MKRKRSLEIHLAAKAEMTKQKLIDVLEREPKLMMKDLAEKADLSLTTVGKYVGILEAEKKIKTELYATTKQVSLAK